MCFILDYCLEYLARPWIIPAPRVDGKSLATTPSNGSPPFTSLAPDAMDKPVDFLHFSDITV